jgi:uncharacterized protein (DUF1800 family)
MQLALSLTFRTLTAFAISLALGAPSAIGKKQESPNSQMEARKRSVHALNRLTFGPHPGDVDRVTAMGVDKWIEEQLHPDKIDDKALDARLTPFRTLRMDTRELVENFPPPQVIKAVKQGRMPMPSDPAKRAVYEAQMERLDRKQEAKVEPAKAPDAHDTTSPAAVGEGKLSAEEREHRRELRQGASAQVEELLDLPPDQRMKQVLKMSPEEQLALSASLKGGRGEAFAEGMLAQQRETLLAMNNPQRVVVSELTQAKLLRAIYSERQLDEVMTDFWFNHFNVFINKGADRYLLTGYERDVIRPHALGKFEDLLVATAKSPAMLFYLDNWLSVGPNSDLARGVVQRNPRKRRGYGRPRNVAARGKKKSSGLNENYGRELMELHTLSVNGGYTQADVTEVAKVFTGWTIAEPRKGGEFKFEPAMHEPGDKIVLGHRIKESGEKEGTQVLRMLARDPWTARFISHKLATRLVLDDPPKTLVDRMTQTYVKKNGDIREVLRTLFRSPEFWAPETYRAKVKTPLEFVVSAVRASGADVDDASALAVQLNNMGMPLYGMQPPTGYSMNANAWVNSSALLARMNFALGMTAGKVKGVTLDSQALAVSATTNKDVTLTRLESTLLEGDVSEQTHATIVKQWNDGKASSATVVGLILGSPEFQRR